MKNWGISIFPVSFNIMCAEETWSLGHLYIFQVFDFLTLLAPGEAMDMCREYSQQR